MRTMATRAVVATLALVATACGGTTDAAGPGPADDEMITTEASEATPPSAAPRCEEVPYLAAPDAWYDDGPVYVGNEMPAEQARAWAQGKPGFEDLWIDRDHAGWVSLAFSQDAEARQEELRAAFPDGGVVVVPVTWTSAQLSDLQDRLVERFRGEANIGVGVLIMQGVVEISFDWLTPELHQAVTDEFAGEPVCVTGADPTTRPEPGPQPTAGDGWTLLADEVAGSPYRTGIAFDAASYEALWREAGVTAPRPDVDFQRDVVIWFGAVFSSSCPDLRLDDVVVDGTLLYARITQLDGGICTADANPRAFVVTFARDRLPAGPFAIQLGAADPPPGAPQERTYVDADLTAPGSTAEPGQVRTDDTPPPARPATSGDVIEPGFPTDYATYVHCGIAWLGELNGVQWWAEAAVDGTEFLPDAWRDITVDDWLTLEVTIHEGDPPWLTAVANGHEERFVAVDRDPPMCD